MTNQFGFRIFAVQLGKSHLRICLTLKTNEIMESIYLSIELYKEGEQYCAYLSDNMGGSGISAEGSTPQECVELLAPHIEEYFYPREEEESEE